MNRSIFPRMRGDSWTGMGLILAGIAVVCALSRAEAQAVDRRPARAETLFVYGPGGPLPAMRDAAVAFERDGGAHVAVTGGPTAPWLAKARRDADVIFSGAENMMSAYVKQLADTAGAGGPLPGRIVESTVEPLYLRPVAILVRPGNPRHIRRFEDLLRPGIRLLVVQGAGQTGLWEDVAGQRGRIADVRAFRKNIGSFAANSGEAKAAWMADTTFDAWLIWNIWQVANPTLADAVALRKPWVVYRDAGVALTTKGSSRESARRFLAFLRSPEGARIFRRWGWTTDHSR